MWFDQSRNLIIYPTVDKAVLQAIPGSRQLGEHLVVSRTLHNCQVLRHFKLPVPPIIEGYDWPRAPGIVPYQSQVITSNFLVTHPHCFCLSDMGTGKTLAALWAADWLMRQEKCRAIIICPLSTVERVWGNAIFANFLDRRTYRILHGTAQQRLDRLAEPADFYIVNHDGVGVGAHTRKKLELDGFSQQLELRDDIRIVIADEGTAYRDSRTRRSKIVRMVFGARPYVWLLTGTPTPNTPVDAFGLAKFVNNALGRTFTGFRDDTMFKPFPQSFKWLPKKDGYDKARKLLQPAIRYEIEQVWDGPEMTTQQRQVPLTVNQQRMLNEVKRAFVTETQSGKRITAINEAAVRTKFLQIVLGAIYDAEHEIHLTDAKPRLEALKEVIREAPGKLLVFAPLTSVVDLTTRELTREWSTEKVYGGTSSKERARIFSAFQDDVEPRILVADPGTMAHGLDLWRSRTVVWFGPTDKTELYLQACKRAHRPGQKYPVTVVQLVATALEREIYNRLQTNTMLQGALLDVIKRGEL